MNLSQKIMPLVAQVCSAVICMPVLVFSMMQLEIYCQPAEPYDVYIKVCCRVTACWAWWHWQITSQVTPSVHYIQTISLWICSSSKTSSADSESSALLFGINAGVLKGQRKIYKGAGVALVGAPWTFDSFWMRLRVPEHNNAPDLFTLVQSPLRLAEVMQPLRVEWSVYTWWVFMGIPQGEDPHSYSAFWETLKTLKSPCLNFPVQVIGGRFFPVTALVKSPATRGYMDIELPELWDCGLVLSTEVWKE